MPDGMMMRELIQVKVYSGIKDMKPDEAQKVKAGLSNPQMLE